MIGQIDAARYDPVALYDPAILIASALVDQTIIEQENRIMLTIEDRLDIADLIARFTQCSDYSDWDTLPTLFTPDIVTELDGLPVRYEGAGQQVEHARESDRQAEGKNRHYNFNMTIAERDGQVFADYAFMNVNAGHAPMMAKIVVTGRMRDRVEKTDDGWKIAHRFVRFDQNFELDF